MNKFSSKAHLLLAAVEQLHATRKEWRQGLLEGMFWLTDELLTATQGHPEHDYEHRYVRTVQQYIDSAFKHPEHEISEMAVEVCCRILAGIPDDGDQS
jgi:hypothetical protein